MCCVTRVHAVAAAWGDARAEEHHARNRVVAAPALNRREARLVILLALASVLASGRHGGPGGEGRAGHSARMGAREGLSLVHGADVIRHLRTTQRDAEMVCALVYSGTAVTIDARRKEPTPAIRERR